jgi:general secretion pathway protein D
MNDTKHTLKFSTALMAALVLNFLLTPKLMAADETPNNAATLKQNFQNVDIKTVIEAVAKLTGKNFIIDPRVKGKVTLIAPEPMPPEALYETLLSILRVHDYVAVPGETAIRIIPANLARDQVPYEKRKQFETDDWVTEVLKVKHVSATKLVAVLRPLVAREGHLVALQDSNRLIVTDSRANLKRIKSILARVDVSPTSSYEVVSIKNGSAEEMVRTLKNLLPESANGQNLKMNFDERSNRIVLAGDAEQRLAMRALIAELDVPVESSGRVQVVYLRYAKAEDLVPVLKKLATNESLLNSVAGLESQTEGGAQKAAPTQVSNLDKSALEERISIEADERTNSVIISAPPPIVTALKGVVKELDIRRAQVLIEAILVEVTESKQAELGVDWVANGPNGVGLINFSGTIPSLVANAGNPAAQASAIGIGATAAMGEISADNQGWGALIRALNSDNQANVLATPTLLTLDNEEAEIIVGKEVPFQTGSYTTNSSGSSNPFTTVERQEVGLKLKIKPQINEGDEVFLEVDQELSSVLPADGAVDLQTSKRQIKTNIIVGDGKMIVLGGLLDERETEVTAKIPGLGDIPLIGGLFRSKQNKREKVNLMIFLRTVIVKNNRMGDYYSNKKYNILRESQNRILEKDSEMLEGLKPRMPTLKQWENMDPATPYGQDEPTPKADGKSTKKATRESSEAFESEEASEMIDTEPFHDELLGF